MRCGDDSVSFWLQMELFNLFKWIVNVFFNAIAVNMFFVAHTQSGKSPRQASSPTYAIWICCAALHCFFSSFSSFLLHKNEFIDWIIKATQSNKMKWNKISLTKKEKKKKNNNIINRIRFHFGFGRLKAFFFSSFNKVQYKWNASFVWQFDTTKKKCPIINKGESCSKLISFGYDSWPIG